jgi:hypothetical protein
MLAEHLAEGYDVTYGNNTEEALWRIRWQQFRR